MDWPVGSVGLLVKIPKIWGPPIYGNSWVFQGVLFPGTPGLFGFWDPWEKPFGRVRALGVFFFLTPLGGTGIFFFRVNRGLFLGGFKKKEGGGVGPQRGGWGEKTTLSFGKHPPGKVGGDKLSDYGAVGTNTGGGSLDSGAR